MGIPMTPYDEFEYLKQKAMKHDLTKSEQDRLTVLMQQQPKLITETLKDGIKFSYVSHPFWDNTIKTKR